MPFQIKIIKKMSVTAIPSSKFKGKMAFGANIYIFLYIDNEEKNLIGYISLMKM